MNIINGGVTAPKGFEAAGVAAGIKYENRKDMALIFSLTPATAAAVFTRNTVKAAPVLWDMDVVKGSGSVHAVIVNAGIANACTGPGGVADCWTTVRQAASLLNIKPKEVLIGSTGVIGIPLPLEKINAGITLLAREKSTSLSAGTDAATAIMTTDTKVKQAAVQIVLNRTLVTIGGMSKGSGMIHPDMCTMLAYVTTDAAITKELLTEAVNEIAADTYNMISVDGDTSTNDTLIVLANGMAGNPLLTEKNEDYYIFKNALHYINECLAIMMAADGEGASTLIEAEITGAKNKEEARLLAKSVISSSLVKTAVYGKDANWGRILCALGYSGVDFDPNVISLYLESSAGKIKVYDGQGRFFCEAKASEILSDSKVRIIADMKMGNETAKAWGCDLTEEYVKINADYRS